MKDEQPEAEKLQSLRKAWQEGIDSGDAGEIDFVALKLEARTRRVFATVDLPDEIIEAIRHAEMDPCHDYLNDLLGPEQ
jgi:hypothetical protein